MSVGPHRAGILRWKSVLQNFSLENLLGIPANKRKQDFLWLLSLSFDFHSLFDVKLGDVELLSNFLSGHKHIAIKQFATSVYFLIHDSLQIIFS